jgi:hypothetical protein
MHLILVLVLFPLASVNLPRKAPQPPSTTHRIGALELPYPLHTLNGLLPHGDDVLVPY